MSSFGFYPGNVMFGDENEYVASFLKDIDSTEPSPFYSETSSDMKSMTSETINRGFLTNQITFRNPESMDLQKPFSIIRKDSKTSEVLLKSSKKVKKEPVKKIMNYKHMINSFSKYSDLEAVLNDPRVDGQTKKKIDLMMRNRISAQMSRDRKKAYVVNLEGENEILKIQNEQLMQELRNLQDRNQLLMTDKLSVSNQFIKASENCPCSALKTEHEGAKESFDDDWLIKDIENVNLSRVFQRRPSIGFMGYSVVLMTMLAMIFMFHNNQAQFNKFKQFENIQYSYKYQMEIENSNGALHRRSPLTTTTEASSKSSQGTKDSEETSEPKIHDIAMKIESTDQSSNKGCDNRNTSKSLNQTSSCSRTEYSDNYRKGFN